jgi:hypothetical protein
MITLTDKFWARALAATAIVAAGLTLSGCSLLNEVTNTTERDDDGEVVEGNDDASAFSIKVGDCLNEPEETAEGVETVPIVPCDDEHDYEAYESIILDDGDFPGDDVVSDAAEEGCFGDAFTEFVGLSYQESVLEVYVFTPTQETWDQLNDREILCLINDVDQTSGDLVPTTGSLEGSAK